MVTTKPGSRATKEQGSTTPAEQQAEFNIEKIYVSDLSLEVPGAPDIFINTGEPEIDFQLGTRAHKLDDHDSLYNVLLNITMKAKLAEKTLFLVEITQGGVFHLKNLPSEQLEMLLGIACPEALLPYARETISHAVTSAGFPPVLLQPINFGKIYMDRQNEKQQEQQNVGES